MTAPRVAQTIGAVFRFSASLFERNALHIKRNVRLREQTVQDVIEHLREEVDELADVPADIFELADILNLCGCIAAHQGWTEEQIAEAMETKLRLRFAIDA